MRSWLSLVLSSLVPLFAAAPAPSDTLADRWLVILGSRRDAAEVIPGLAAVQAHPELHAAPGTLLSSRYKNLMPCYTVTYALATTDKAAALALSASLTGLKVDNYVKNAGSWVGSSSTIDAWCANPPASRSSAVDVLAVADARLWVRAELPAEVEAGLIAGAPAPRTLSRAYDAWVQPLTVRNAGTLEIGAPWRVLDVATGRSITCAVDGFAALTLGTPHFGVLQAGVPKAPACGTAAVYASLACGEPLADGGWVGVPAGGPPMQWWKPVGSGSRRMYTAAERVLNEEPVWQALEAAGSQGSDQKPLRQVVVGLYQGPSSRVAVVEGHWQAGDVCGGTDELLTYVYAVDGEKLGARIGELSTASFGELRGLFDLEGDGVPERVLTTFPTDTRVLGADGQPEGELAFDYCDCPC